MVYIDGYHIIVQCTPLQLVSADLDWKQVLVLWIELCMEVEGCNLDIKQYFLCDHT